MCWLLPGSFDCVCCPRASVHRPPIACLAVFLCGPGALFLHTLSRPSTICPFPPHGWSAPDGLPLLLCKQPIWAAGHPPHLMPVEQGLPWHPVATGLAGQAIPFVVAASHAHAPPPLASNADVICGGEHSTEGWPNARHCRCRRGRDASPPTTGVSSAGHSALPSSTEHYARTQPPALCGGPTGHKR